MNSLRNLPRQICSFALFIILTTALATAQQARGTLRGLITDELGAAIVGANVTLTDATGVQKKTTTNGEGVYNFVGLAPVSTHCRQSLPVSLRPRVKKLT